MSEDHIEIWTDGACKGNPGPGGWGVLLRWREHTKELCGGERETTNNRMELTAAIRALEALQRPLPVRLRTDSRYVMDGIEKWIHGWKRNGWRTSGGGAVKNEDLWRALDTLNVKHRVTWIWVKGHDGEAGNERADALANRGITELGR